MKNKLSNKLKPISSRPTAFDLFAGCGGLSQGLSRAGFDVHWANEYWKPAAQTYRLSHSTTTLFEEDARRLLAKIIDGGAEFPSPGDVDLLAGGPPCQGFSGFNRHRKPEDPRNSMLDVFLGFVRHLKPRMVLIENVPGLLTLDEGKLAQLLLSSFEELGYKCKVGLLQAGYYGIPQNRWRTFVVATSDRTALPSFPLPTHEFPRIMIHGSAKIKVQAEVIKPNPRSPGKLDLFSYVTVGDAISDLPRNASLDPKEDCEYASPPQSDYQRLLRNGSSRVRDHLCPKVEPVTLERICAVPRKPGAGWLDLPDQLKPANLKRHGDSRYANRYGRLDWGTIFNTILTRPHPYWSRVIHPEEDRLLSIRECARAQSFFDSIIFCGTMSEKFKQIGNAVPPLLAEKMGESLIATLFSTNINRQIHG